MANRTHRLVVGLMSGTSADGIDAVLARLEGSGPALKAAVLEHLHVPFPARQRREILRVCLHGQVAEICELNFALGEEFARAVLDLLKKAGVAPKKVDLVCSHGQTIHHLPRARHPSTLQIGEPSVIAERTGITTVADFRVRDMAAGGQGAPLVPYTDWALLRDREAARVIQNIGGIGNLTFLPPGARLDEVMAFDTGPGNMVIDAVVGHLTQGRLGFDRNGEWAAQGQPDTKLLSWMLRHRFLKQAPPKTTGREEFGESFVNRVLARAEKQKIADANLVATCTAFTAVTIVDACSRFILPRLTHRVPKLQVVLGGGGAQNQTLRGLLDHELRVCLGLTPEPGLHSYAKPTTSIKEFELLTHEAFGIRDAAKEALAFAILGYETMQGQRSNVPRATGARKPVLLGKIIPGH